LRLVTNCAPGGILEKSKGIEPPPAPTMAKRPRQARAATPVASVALIPTQSKMNVAPIPPLSARICSAAAGPLATASSAPSSLVGSGLGPDLAYLMSLVANNRLNESVGWRCSWDRAREAMDALLARRVEGKAVLELR
jgi:hypothetical protein